MDSANEVKNFLNEFKQKLEIFSIIFLDERNKNLQALADLEITPAQRTEYLKKLEVKDYSSRPNKEEYDKSQTDFWVFGKIIKKKEVYVKIRMGKKNRPVICISFHQAEHKMKYPFKKGGE